jgi:hypothetical protein
MQVQKLL